MTTVHVPDVPKPTAKLCWKQDAVTLARCDRRAQHDGPCWPEMVATLQTVQRDLATLLQRELEGGR